MMVPTFFVAGLINIIANHFNYNIDIKDDPDFDIRVKRDTEFIEAPLPIIKLDKNHESINTPVDLETPNILSILKGGNIEDKLKNRRISKRHTQHIKITSSSNDFAKNNDQQTSRGHNGNMINDNNNVNIRWKSKPNVFLRTFNAIADGLNSANPIQIPNQSSNNMVNFNNLNTVSGSNDNVNKGNAISDNNDKITNRNNERNGSNGGKRIDGGEKRKTDAACVYCFFSGCAGNAQMVDGKCVEITDDYNYD